MEYHGSDAVPSGGVGPGTCTRRPEVCGFLRQGNPGPGKLKHGRQRPHGLAPGQRPTVLAKSGRHGTGTGEKAKDIPIDIVQKLEALTKDAPTTQMRCYCGFFSLLGCSSLRAAEALRTRSLKYTDDSISGVSRMKTKRPWTRWFADRRGFGGEDWCSAWMEELNANDLPGKDFMLMSTTKGMDEWLGRPAEYPDVRRAFYLVLMALFGMSAEEAVEFSPHGFRHVLISCGQQVRADLECLGHWS